MRGRVQCVPQQAAPTISGLLIKTPTDGAYEAGSSATIFQEVQGSKRTFILFEITLLPSSVLSVPGARDPRVNDESEIGPTL